MNKKVAWMMKTGVGGKFEGSLPRPMARELVEDLERQGISIAKATRQAWIYRWIEDGLAFEFSFAIQKPIVDQLTWRHVEADVPATNALPPAPENEQYAVRQAITNEMRQTRYCPNCGRDMRGDTYCEDCDA